MEGIGDGYFGERSPKAGRSIRTVSFVGEADVSEATDVTDSPDRDASRYAMQSALIKAIGAEEAETLMEHLPPLGWGDAATKTDLALLNAELRLEMEKLRSEMEKQRSEFKDAMHRQMVWMISTIFAAITVGSAMAGGIAAWIEQ